VSLFGAAGGIALVDVPTMAVLGTWPTVGSVSGCGIADSNDGRTIFFNSAGGMGHFYRLDTATDTLTEDTGYGPIGVNLHGLVITANEKHAYIAAVGTDEVKVLDLKGNEVSTISLDWRPGIPDAPDSMAPGQQHLRDPAVRGPGGLDQGSNRHGGLHRRRAVGHNRLGDPWHRGSALREP
jgi:hypothetical protein